MKKYVVLLIAITISAFSFAQKTELKGAEKALKSNNFASAKTFIKSAEAMESSMDLKTLAKFYFLKGQAYYANGTGTNDDVKVALESFDKLNTTEEKSGKRVYSSKAAGIKQMMVNSFLEKAQTALESKDYTTSYTNFENVYRISTADTVFLFNAAVLASESKDYDKSLELFDELKELGYTGITDEFYATNIKTGKEEFFPSKLLRDAAVKAKSHTNPKNSKSKSSVGEIAKSIANIYISKGENEKAIEAIEEAKKSDPNNFNLIYAEAGIVYQLGQIDRYKELVSEAIKLQPNNPELYYNLGIVASQSDNYEEAKMRFEKAIEIDQEFVDAYIQLGALVLAQEQGIIDEMNKLGSSAADDRKYEELKEARQQLYYDAIPYLEKALELDTTSEGAARTLMNIYSALDDTENFNKMKAKVEAIENGQ